MKINSQKLYPLALMIFCVMSIALIYLLKNRSSLTASRNTQQIYAVLNKYRITYDIDAHGVDPITDTNPQPIVGVDGCIQQIMHFVEHNTPISMLLVGFPFKSPNHENKTIGNLPDMAERKSLEYLQAMLDEITAVYDPGAQITIFCDGISFAQYFMVPPHNVVRYEQALQRLAADLPNITLYTSASFMKDYNFSRVNEINQLIDSYPPSDEEFKKSDHPLSEVARKRFTAEFDYDAGRKKLETETLDSILAKVSAREARLRNFLTEKFPTSKYLRLTVHFSKDVNKKFGIKLSPTSDITPYHGTAVINNDGSWNIQSKKDVDLQKYVPTTKIINGLECPYYDERS